MRVFSWSKGGTRFVRVTVGLLLGLSLLPALSAWADPYAQTQSDLDELAGKSGKDFEVAFLSEMIQHHQSAIEMSNLAPDRAAHQELKDAAQKIIADQRREISEMTDWLQQWYGVAPTADMMHDMPGMGMSDMMALESLKGDEFDKSFLKMMRMHHMGAVDMAKLVPTRATHDELKTLSQNIITSQSAEIQQFEGWLKTWYNETSEGSMPAGSMSGEQMVGTSTPTGNMSGGATAGGTDTNSGTMPAAGVGAGGLMWLVLALAAILAISILAGGIWLRKRT
jgi:uncharacterized protein (DUF305 family)